jgi:hypothetical protein
MYINLYEIFIPMTTESVGGRGEQWKEDRFTRLHLLVLQTRTA